jgi:transcriptional regulator with XRE-family HTH domain
MSRKNLMVRLFRALSGQTQRDFARTAGVDESLLARYELGVVEPGLEHLTGIAEAAGFTVADGEGILRYLEELRAPRRRAGAGIEDLQDEVSATLSRSYQRLLRLPLPERRLDDDPPKW